MASVHDVAAYILARQGLMSTWKLQKLAYYSQAWHLVWDEEPLFEERIQAWANGPVVRELYDGHKGSFTAEVWNGGDPDRLAENERETIALVLEDYGHLTGRQLSHLTHNEGPWQEAREGLPPTARSTREITPESMHAYYSALDADQEAQRVDAIDWSDVDSA